MAATFNPFQYIKKSLGCWLAIRLWSYMISYAMHIDELEFGEIRLIAELGGAGVLQLG